MYFLLMYGTLYETVYAEMSDPGLGPVKGKDGWGNGI